MTEKRFFMSGYMILDGQNNNRRISREAACKLLNRFNDDCENWEKSFKILCEENKELLCKVDWADECGVQWGKEYNKWIGDIDNKKLEKMGYTKENFKGSRTEALLESMISSTEEMIQEEIPKLMRGNGLTYGEARMIATGNVLNSIVKGLNNK